MRVMRDEFLVTAGSALSLLRHPAVAAAWDRPSALPEFSVRGLAGHLAAQVCQVPAVLAEPVGTADPVTVAEHYARAAWIGAALDADVNVSVRTSGERLASGGADRLAARFAATLENLRGSLAAESGNRVVRLPWTGWSLTLDDFLATRLVELTVHCDDLAVSAGVPMPDLPTVAVDIVLCLLCRLARRRHGTEAVLRALSRAERAPATIVAI